MLIRLLPLITGFAPIIAAHLSYLIAIRSGILAACIPYIEGCTSISATGRYPPASFLFKSVMMPEAILLAAYWLFSVAWLRSLSLIAGRNEKPGTSIAVFGVAGAIFLIVYVTFLGTQGPRLRFHATFRDLSLFPVQRHCTTDSGQQSFVVVIGFANAWRRTNHQVSIGHRDHSVCARHSESYFESDHG